PRLSIEMHRPSIVPLCFLVAWGTWFLLPSASWGQSASFLGKPLKAWLNDLDSDDGTVRRNAAFALGRMGEGAAGEVKRLVHMLQRDQDTRVKEAAAFALGEIGIAGLDTFADLPEELVDRLSREKDALVRRSIVVALGSLGKHAAAGLPALEKAL